MIILDNRNVILIPKCLVSPNYQAKWNGKKAEWQELYLNYLKRKDIKIVTMPCPEATFDSCYTGLGRDPHSYYFYKKLDGFNEHCNRCGYITIRTIERLIAADYTICAIVGIKNSPTCAAGHLFVGGREGTKLINGIFLNTLTVMATKYDIPIVEIDKRFIANSIKQLDIALLSLKDKE